MSYSRIAVLLLLAEAACSSSTGAPSANEDSGSGSSGQDDGAAASGKDTGTSSPDGSVGAVDANDGCVGCSQDDAGSNPSADGATTDATQADSAVADTGTAAPSDTGPQSVDAMGDATPVTDQDSGAQDGAALDSASPDSGAQDSASQDSAGQDSTTPDTGADANGNSPGPDSGTPTDSGSDAPIFVPPVLAILTANQTGRSGDDLTMAVQGSDINKTSFGLDITLEDGNGTPLAAFPAGAVAASAERVVLFDTQSAVGVKTFSRTVTLPGFMDKIPMIRKIVASVVDTGGHSNAMTTSVATQAVRTLHQSCDPKVITDRCTAGLSCDATSSTCNQPAAPQIKQFVYITSPAPNGARILLAGTDPADDLNNFHLEFLDSNGQPVQVDLSGNQNYYTSFDLDVAHASSLGAFFYADQTTQGFDSTVKQLAATPMGSSSGSGSRVVAPLTAPPVVSTGSACDSRGFASCVAGDTCIASAGSFAGTCGVTATELTTLTASASVLDPGAGPTFVTGYAAGTNLWGDPPSGCVPPGVHNYPQGMVLLHLDDPMASLTLSSASQETNASVALFVLPGTGTSVGTEALGCQAGFPSNLVLSNVSAGDYTIVINSMTPNAVNFALTVQ